MIESRILIATASQSAPSETEMALCMQLPDSGVPEWVHLIGVGELRAIDGRRWTNKNPAAVAAASMTNGRDLVFDYEHQTDFAKENGKPAPAAGWIKELQVRDDGIWGRVEWTARARAMIEAKEYRFISPTFSFDTTTREVGRILRAALTNAPAFNQLAAIAKQETNGMDEFLKALRKALGLSDDSDQAAVLAATTALATRVDEHGNQVKAIAKAAGLDESLSAEDIASKIATAIATAKTQEPDPAKYVKVEDFTKLSNDFATLKAERVTETATAKVDQAIEDGKLIPVQREWALALAKKDMAAFDDFIAKQPVVVQPGGSELPATKRTSDELTADDKAMCRALGLSEADYKKTLSQEIAQ